MDIYIDVEKCTGCQLCVKACPYGAIEMAGDTASITGACTLCGACVSVCPVQAIIRELPAVEDIDNSDYRGVWVVAEVSDGQLAGVSLELLGKGRELADTLQAPLSAVLVGDDVAGLVVGAAESGADQVYLAEDPALAQYRTGPYTDVLSGLINQHKPEIVLLGATEQGRDLAPRVAARVKTGLTADCTGLEIDEQERLLIQTRPAFGGNIMARIITRNHRPQMATVRPRVMRRLEPVPGREAAVVKVPVAFDEKSILTRIVEIARDEGAEAVNLQDADIIVAGGRGLKKPENFGVIYELAEALGGVVGASRPTVDEGWIPPYHQVGQTGRTVQPKLYIACGISGAVQHLAGMSGADCVVAVNSDPNAAIFDIAHYGIVGDLFEIVPALTEIARQELAQD